MRAAAREHREKLDGQITKIVYGTGGSIFRDCPAPRLTSKNSQHLEHEQVRCRKLALPGHQRLDLLRHAYPEQIVDDGGGVEDGHSP